MYLSLSVCLCLQWDVVHWWDESMWSVQSQSVSVRSMSGVQDGG